MARGDQGAFGPTMPWDQPIYNQPYALAYHQNLSHPADHLSPAEPTHSSGDQYGTGNNFWNNGTVSNAAQFEAPFSDAGLQYNLMDPSNEGFNLGFENIIPDPAWNFGITAQDYRQPIMPNLTAARLSPARNPIMAPATPPAAAPATNEDRIRCSKGCLAIFRRGSDYRRHMNMHKTPRYKCPVYACDKTFYRADKLRDHARQGHKGANPLRIAQR
jgi:hypothetical protein